MDQSTEELDTLILDFEAAVDKEIAFYSVYAGLRMFFDSKKKSPKGTLNIAAAEAYCRLQELKDQYPVNYKECEEEYNERYGEGKAVQNIQTFADLKPPILLSEEALTHLATNHGYIFDSSTPIEPIKIVAKIMIDEAMVLGNATMIDKLSIISNDFNEEVGCSTFFEGTVGRVSATVQGSFDAYFIQKPALNSRRTEKVPVLAKVVRLIDEALKVMGFVV